MVCVGGVGGQGSSVCNGDRGGPLPCLANGRWVLRGAASWVPDWFYVQRIGTADRAEKYLRMRHFSPTRRDSWRENIDLSNTFRMRDSLLSTLEAVNSLCNDT